MKQLRRFSVAFRSAKVALLVSFAIVTNLGLVSRCAADDQKLTSQQVEFFEAKIRPILVQHCYECHGTEGEDIEGGLVLDSKWGWETGGDSGPAIVPGNLDESLLIDAVRYGENIVSAMPPKSKLPDEKIRLLERWVQMGAPDPRAKVDKTDLPLVGAFDLQQRVDEYWCWQGVDDPAPPDVIDEGWPLGEIDRFILHKLDSAGIRPAPPADKQTWLRRVYFDLIGLPPTVAQLDAFVADESEVAYEKVVEQLLESPQFGEKWARHWMDLVRYAETYGHEFDYPIPHATEYRDYLIRAFNADVPYNQFVMEHIAGDLLKNPRLHPRERFNESVIGTGFWYLHEATHAPTDVLKNEADIIGNQLDVFGKAFLGLTVACARCHDHKFDAISTADYYALSAFIQSSCRQQYPLDPGERINESMLRLQDLQTRAQDHIRSSERGTGPSPADYFAVAARLIRKASDDSATNKGLPLPSAAVVTDEAERSQLDAENLQRWIGLLTAADPTAANPTPVDVLATRIKDPAGCQRILNRLASDRTRQENDAKDKQLLESFDDDQLPQGWTTTGDAFQVVGIQPMINIVNAQQQPGTVDSGYFGSKATGVLRSPTFTITTPKIHVRTRASANVRMNVIIDNYQMISFHGLLFKGTFIKDAGSDTKGKWQWKSFAADLKKYLGHKAYIEFVDDSEAAIAIDEIWFSSGGAPPAPPDPLVEQFAADQFSFAQAWADAVVDLGNGERSALVDWLLENDLVSLDELAPGLGTLVREAHQVASAIPRPRFVLAMAEGTREAADVHIRGSHTNLGEKVPPRNLSALGGDQGTRLELASQVASADNPLLARVIVNRIWHHLFGRGIIPSVDDFGPQGQPATHPLLLDYLASDFIASGWSIKTAIRKLVLSQTYRQSSVAHSSNDPQKIATDDPTNSLLHRMRVRRLPAESIRDAILAVSGRLDKRQFGGSVATHRTPFMTGRGARGSGPLDGDGRRTIYLSVYRNFINPFLTTFDMPNPFGPKGRRGNSNVPAQALTLMNDPFVIQQSKLWADKLISHSEDRVSRLRVAVKTAHGVDATPRQIERLQGFLDKQMAQGANQKDAWSDLAHALLNMKSFYYLQ